MVWIWNLSDEPLDFALRNLFRQEVCWAHNFFKGSPGKVRDPFTEIIMVCRDKASLFSIKGI